MDGSPKGHAAYFEMSFYPNVELVSTVRRFVLNAYQRLFLDPEIADQVALATHELLENAVKYSQDDVTHFRVDVVRHQDRGEVIITTKNRANADDVRNLEQNITELRGSDDPFAFYQQKMREAARREHSGLGLARVRAEAEMEMTCEMSGELVVIHARGTYPMRHHDG